jgi:polyvinyl alcohol dehydrogenase (cytochrome)
MCCVGIAMKAITSRLTGATLVLASIFCSADSNGVAAEEFGSASPSPGLCPAAGPSLADPLSAPHWNGWGVDISQRRFQPGEMAQLAAEDVPRLKLKWAFGFPGADFAFAQPTVMGGRIFVGSQRGKVYSLDANTGCTYWEFDSAAPVRSAITIGPDSVGWLVYFGDQRGNVRAVDVMTGKALWTTLIEDHPAAWVIGSPTLVGATLFVPVSSHEEVMAANPKYPCCSFRGSVVALQASTGKTLWKSYTIAEEPKAGAMSSAGVQLRGPSGAAVWSSPTFDPMKDMIYVTTGDNYSDPPTDTSDAILAFNAVSGKMAWSRQITSGDAFNVACAAKEPGPNCPAAKGPDLDFGSSAILVSLRNGKRALIGGQKSGVVTAVDPDRSGAILWQTRVGRGGPIGGVQWGSAADDSKIYVAVSDTKFSRVAPGTRGAQTSPFNPNVTWLLDSRTGGGLHALSLETGEEVWQTPHPGCNDVPGCGPAQSAAVTAIPGIVFSGGIDGHLRAYSADHGRIVWDVDTKREYRTVNGVAARGGSMDGPGAVLVGGMLYVGSGYGLWGGTPGNALLAYSVEGR